MSYRAISVLLFASLAFGAIGDNAPSVPTTYAQTHPHLPYPTSAYLTNLWNNRAGSAAYVWTAATAWTDGTSNCGSSCGAYTARLLFLATAAEVANSGPNAAAFVAKVQGIVVQTTATLTNGSTAFTVTSGAGFAVGMTIVGPNLVNGVTLSSGSGTSWTMGKPAIASGSFPVQVFAGGTYSGAWNALMAYDWFYSQLGPTNQPIFRQALYNLMCANYSGSTCTNGEESNYFVSGATNNSAYSDTNYLRQTIPYFQAALAIYPDDAVNSLPHLRWAMDYFFNSKMPAWKHAMTGNTMIQSTDASSKNGAGIWNGWNDYEGKSLALTTVVESENLAWAVASDGGAANQTAAVATWFGTTNPWLRNLIYWLPYEVEPDFAFKPNVDESLDVVSSEYSVYSGGPGFLNEIAGIYSGINSTDQLPVCVSRTMNDFGGVPNGFDPSAYPWWTPDSSANAGCTAKPWLGASSVLSPYKDFPGWGMLDMRTGFTEGDTDCDIIYGDSFWDHPKANAGAIECYHKGRLLITSGTYAAGSASPHAQGYSERSIAHNVPLICDPNDYYGVGGDGGAITTATQGEYWPFIRAWNGGATTYSSPQNDCGQRPIGSSAGNINEVWNGTSFVLQGQMSSVENEPSNEAQWYRAWAYYHRAKLIAWSIGSGNKYAYASIDLTAAYNNPWSRVPYDPSNPFTATNSGTANRSFRADKVVRQVLFVPIGHDALLYVYDQINANPLNYPNLTKKDLFHFINAPTYGAVTSGSAIPFTEQRTETVTAPGFTQSWLGNNFRNIASCNPSPCTSGSAQYVFNGELDGYLTWPLASGSWTPGTTCPSSNVSCITTVGGPGHEFQITDPILGSHNYNETEPGGAHCDRASTIGSTTENWTFTTGTNDALLVSVDGGSNQAISATASGLCSSGAPCTCATLVGTGNMGGQLTGATASCQVDPFTNLSHFVIQSTAVAPSGSISVITTANNAYAALGLQLGNTATGSQDQGLGCVAGWMHPTNLTGPIQPGSYRSEETIGTNNRNDQFINVMLLRDASGDPLSISIAPATVTEAAGTGACPANATLNCLLTTVTTTQAAGTCLYTITSPVDGSDADVKASGAGCPVVIN